MKKKGLQTRRGTRNNHKINFLLNPQPPTHFLQWEEEENKSYESIVKSSRATGDLLLVTNGKKLVTGMVDLIGPLGHVGGTCPDILSPITLHLLLIPSHGGPASHAQAP